MSKPADTNSTPSSQLQGPDLTFNPTSASTPTTQATNSRLKRHDGSTNLFGTEDPGRPKSKRSESDSPQSESTQSSATTTATTTTNPQTSNSGPVAATTTPTTSVLLNTRSASTDDADSLGGTNYTGYGCCTKMRSRVWCIWNIIQQL